MYASAKQNGSIQHDDELQKGANTAEPQQRAPRQLLAALVAVSVVIFLAYICAVSIQRRITFSPFSRQLAARGGGEEFDESDDSCSTESAADTSPEGQPTTTPPPDVSAEALQAQSGRSVSTSSTDTTAAASGKTVPGTAAPQVETQWRRTGLKRKGAEQSSVEREAKQLRPETTLQPPPSPLDPALDSLIDSLLAGADDPLSEDVWLLDEPPLLLAADSSIVSTPSTSRTDSEARPVETALQPSRAVETALQLSRAVETTLQPSPPPLDPGLDSLIDSVLFGGSSVFSEVFWRLDEVTKESPQPPVAEAHAAAKEGTASTSTAPVEDSLASSSRASSASQHLPSGVTPSQESGSAEQLASSTELPADATVISLFRFVGDVLPRIPPEALRMHPFYRYPPNRPAFTSRSFNARLASSLAPSQKGANPALAMCMEIMKKPSLSQLDFESLLMEAERLFAFAMYNMPLTYRRGHALYAIETLGTIFLVLDTLYCAAEVIGEHSMKQDWWPSLIRRIGSVKFVPRNEYQMTDKALRNAEVGRALNAVLEYYRRGLRPPALLVVGLKEALLCEPGSSKFKAEQWKAWRRDAAHWRLSLQPSVAENK
ncbi:uncharacterized protein EMH_0043060 [Eimeria mitis]|uniref:Transmembrane protein n=1 Tax=Eimeria mitis TaxID=44415 RepID=U6JTE2_9EIME|nr:uncharacterized protein EMH_0043060 [Eimeria mitis]CDJ28689.1 hypothetical protein EMH_0043060 [Eimeria mitis]